MAVHGWRLWRIHPDGSLRSVWRAAHERWTTGPQQATCSAVALPVFASASGRRHRAPATDCDCGYYLTLTSEPLAELWVPSDVVAGTAQGWGTVVPHAFGYRTERCRITALLDGPVPGSSHDRWCRADEIQLAAARYQVPMLPAELAPCVAPRDGKARP
jgi:hypothetical protein